MELRQAGIRTPILVLGGFAPPQADLILAHDLVPAVFRVDQVDALAAAAARRGTRARVHLKIDTGMGRLGVTVTELAEFTARLAAAEQIDLVGAFSHLAVADEAADPFTRRQVDLLARAVDTIRAHGLRPTHIHLANSAAVLEHHPTWLTLVRPGLLLYGYPPSPRTVPSPWQPVLSIHSRVIFLKSVEPGTSLGYGRTFVTPRPARIATLPIGYEDGLPFLAGNRGHVLLRGRRAPIVGRVSMDLTTIDVTDIPDAALGDPAVLLGTSGAERIGADRLAAWAGTHVWDVMCGIGSRVPRVYVGRHGSAYASRYGTDPLA
jgi:alanine racemase